MRGRAFQTTWTDEEIATLRKSFGAVKRKKDWAAILPAHSWSAIVQKARTLGLRKKFGWTVQEIDVLRANYETMPWDELHKLLPRREWANVQKKASALGLKRNVHKDASPFRIIRDLRRVRRDRGILCEDLAEKFGVYGSMISAWECATRNKSAPTLKSLIDWAGALGFDLVLQPRRVQGFDPARAMGQTAQRQAPLRAAR